VPPRLAGAAAAVLLTLSLLACSGKAVQQPPPKNDAQPQPPAAPRPDPLRNADVRFDDIGELFDLAEEGEAQYRGKIINFSGKVNLEAVHKPGPGATSKLTFEGDPGGPPFAIAAVSEDSWPLLSSRTYGPVASVHVHGVYTGRDARGTVLLEPAKVYSLTRWLNWPRQKKANKQPEPKKPAAPVAVTAEKLAQDFMANPGDAYKRYGAQPVQVTGVVSKRQENKGAVFRIDFIVPSQDKKSDWTLVMVPLKPIPLGDKAASDVAVGKRVTLRGNVIATGVGATTITECEIVRE
jgi:hypothetical protein